MFGVSERPVSFTPALRRAQKPEGYLLYAPAARLQAVGVAVGRAEH